MCVGGELSKEITNLWQPAVKCRGVRRIELERQGGTSQHQTIYHSTSRNLPGPCLSLQMLFTHIKHSLKLTVCVFAWHCISYHVIIMYFWSLLILIKGWISEMCCSLPWISLFISKGFRAETSFLRELKQQTLQVKQHRKPYHSFPQHHSSLCGSDYYIISNIWTIIYTKRIQWHLD